MIETAIPNHLEAKTALDTLLDSFQDSRMIEENAIKTATLGIALSVQIRDYALGAIGNCLDADDSVSFIKAIEAIGGESAALSAIKAAYYYEAEDTIGANLALNKALELQNGHSLALLLRRVMSAGWPPASFASMRRELHPKVEAGLKDLEAVAVNASK
jgi:protein-disulfide isomerase-like protein with CxxC motif